MYQVGREHDTICALSTPAGRGGISVIRVSGGNSFSSVRELCPFLPEAPESHRVYFGQILKFSNQEPIDEVLVTYFKQGRSYTGEETLEISCHGNPILVQEILNELVRAGCRPADRGEFTFRAFSNGKIDLVQAEGVLSLIESQSPQAAKLAYRQLQGRMSDRFIKIEEEIVFLLSRVEAAIDFSTEGLEIAPYAEISKHVSAMIQHCEDLISAYEKGRFIRDGFRVALIGLPNSGKSSLLNRLLQEDRAIVTEIAGTTRDVLESDIYIDGRKVTLVDTAGLRSTDDVVEKLGVERSRKTFAEADHVFYLYDKSKGLTKDDHTNLEFVDHAKLTLLCNKSDLDGPVLPPEFAPALEISAKTGAGIEALEKTLQKITQNLFAEDAGVVIQARHFGLVRQLKGTLEKAHALVLSDGGEELIALELRESLAKVNEILGRAIDEDVISRIFKDFCIGK